MKMKTGYWSLGRTPPKVRAIAAAVTAMAGMATTVGMTTVGTTTAGTTTAGMVTAASMVMATFMKIIPTKPALMKQVPVAKIETMMMMETMKKMLTLVSNMTTNLRTASWTQLVTSVLT